MPGTSIQVESEELILGCEEGLFVAIDWDKIGGRDAYIDAGANECGVGALGWAIVLAYDGDVLTEGGPRELEELLRYQCLSGQTCVAQGSQV